MRSLLGYFAVLRAGGAFVAVPAVEQAEPIRLARASALGLSYTGVAQNSSAASLSNFALSLNARFEGLNSSGFAALQAAYSSWSASRSKVRYAPGQAYTLLDFLPPALQATSGRHFHVQHANYSLPSFVAGREARQAEVAALLASNCWGFAWAVVEAAAAPTDRLTISLASPPVAWAAFTSARFSQLQTSVTEPALLETSNVAGRNSQLRPGDLLLIWHDNGGGQGLYLDHVAIVIDDDLYYERAGSGDNVPFRLTTWDGLVADWTIIAFHFEWRRRAAGAAVPNAAAAFGLQTLAAEFPLFSELKPEVAERFSMTADYNASVPPKSVVADTYTWMVTLPAFDVGADGRSALPAAAFDAGALEIAIPKDIYQAEGVVLV